MRSFKENDHLFIYIITHHLYKTVFFLYFVEKKAFFFKFGENKVFKMDEGNILGQKIK